MSAYEYFGRRFGRGVRLYSSFAFAIGHFSKMGFVFYLLALTLASMTGWPISGIIALTAVITIFYTLIGGVEAVVWSDVVQGFVLWAGILVSLGYLLFLPPQGPHAVLADAWNHHKMSLGSTAFRFDRPTIIVLVIYGFFFYLQKYTADQTVVQRYLIAAFRSRRDSRHRARRRPLPPRVGCIHAHRQPALELLPPHRRDPPKVHHKSRRHLPALPRHAHSLGPRGSLRRRAARLRNVHARL